MWADSENPELFADVLLEFPQVYGLLDHFMEQGCLDVGRAIRSGPADDHETAHAEKHRGRVRMSTDTVVNRTFQFVAIPKEGHGKPRLICIGRKLARCRGGLVWMKKTRCGSRRWSEWRFTIALRDSLHVRGKP